MEVLTRIQPSTLLNVELAYCSYYSTFIYCQSSYKEDSLDFYVVSYFIY